MYKKSIMQVITIKKIINIYKYFFYLRFFSNLSIEKILQLQQMRKFVLYKKLDMKKKLKIIDPSFFYFFEIYLKIKLPKIESRNQCFPQVQKKRPF